MPLPPEVFSERRIKAIVGISEILPPNHRRSGLVIQSYSVGGCTLQLGYGGQKYYLRPGGVWSVHGPRPEGLDESGALTRVPGRIIASWETPGGGLQITEYEYDRAYCLVHTDCRENLQMAKLCASGGR